MVVTTVGGSCSGGVGECYGGSYGGCSGGVGVLW